MEPCYNNGTCLVRKDQLIETSYTCTMCLI
jgi:hypothetical protein